MRTIEIYTETVQTGIGHSSKGNQLKWLQDGWWYKADGFGFESLAETPARINRGLNRDGRNSSDGKKTAGKSSETMVRECSAEKRFGTVVGKYSSGEIQRVEDVLRYQAGKYQYFFGGSSG